MRDAALSLPPNDDRQLHDRRPVVVLSGPDTNSDPNWPFVVVAPLSTATTLKTKFCIKVAAGEGNLTKKTWARVTAVQPLMKSDLEDYSGPLPPDRLAQIQASLMAYLGIIEFEGSPG